MDEQELPRVLQQLWGIEGRSRPGPKPAFHISDIGRAAVKLADAGGLNAVSMSKVAAELGFTTMSLYRYVGAKDDLYVVMLEQAFGEPPALDPTKGWREQITAWAQTFRDGLRQHPWILQIPIQEPPLSPHQLAWMEAGLQAFDSTPLTPQDRLSAMLLVNIYVRGTAQLTANMLTEPEAVQVADRLYTERLTMLATPDRFPGIAATLEVPPDEGYAGDFDAAEFGFGLDTVLDGIQSRIDRLTS
ncbi:TetR/AcrR family transcriptional regulator [Kribbella sp.]|uniref:TetR/AcrR family transcriptional regulator n=1 Tax=Kribbella sp. TaxID=1871183 RepID=UPI002D267B04|nr:TetR/AcrR family transcriptional regulator [Kribbella sp.]HZX05208.1 TetR/AcrR family transcriptional regulator [Kribbella sp.]